MKEFNLTEYLKDPSKKVVTRDGREVRIICTDMNSVDDYKIVALVKKNYGEEVILCYRKSGKDKYCPDYDLFFAPIKREGWINLYKDEGLSFVNGDVYENEKDAKKAAIDDPDFIASVKIEWEE